MKKIMAMTVLAAGMAVCANANIIINWQADAGFFDNVNGQNGILDPNGSTIARLVYSSDNSADNVIAGGAFQAGGNDVVLATFTVSSPSASTFADFNAGTYNGTFLSGFIYAQIFDKGGNSAITQGMLYYNSPLQATVNNSGAPNPPQVLQMNTDLTNGNELTRTVLAAVPEPSTYAFMGIGAVLMAIRRFRRKA